jgi:hypothetical protein
MAQLGSNDHAVFKSAYGGEAESLRRCLGQPLLTDAVEKGLENIAEQ